MSIESQALVWAHSQATGSALLALLAIADHDGDGGSWPSMDTIAQRARVTREAARKIVRKLEAMGEIVTDRNGGGGLRTAHHMRTNRYEVRIVCPPSCDRSARHRERTAEATEAEILDGIGWPKPVDHTPPPNGGVPSARRGAPPPHGGANHPLNTLNHGNSETEANSVTASAHESEKPKADPATVFRRAINEKQLKRKAARAVAKSLTPEQIAWRDEHREQPCPAKPDLHHFIPPSMTECARGCGLTFTQSEATA